MTGYHITLGYQSGISRRVGDQGTDWEHLKAAAEMLCQHQDQIAAEVRKERVLVSAEVLDEYVSRYRLSGDEEDLTLNFVEPSGDEKGEVWQAASGGGESRAIKEAVRRAFCRLLILEMHRLGIEVNLTVA